MAGLDLFLFAAAIIAAVFVDLEAGVGVDFTFGVEFEFDVVEDDDESSWVNGIDGDAACDLFSFDGFDVLLIESVALRLSLFDDWSCLLDVAAMADDDDDDGVVAAVLAFMLDLAPIELDVPCWDLSFFFCLKIKW